MTELTNRDLVLALWDAFDRFEFEAVADLLHDDFICEWTQSAELIRGRDNFIAVNKHYPGRWRIHVNRLVDGGDVVVTEIHAVDGDVTNPAISFFEFADRKIIKIREFWPDSMEAQSDRAQWVERLPVSPST
ncbi:MAG: nuclear transport factor 2 family protein [Aggregatilineales bacterium]